jgi:hypothetical protein
MFYIPLRQSSSPTSLSSDFSHVTGPQTAGSGQNTLRGEQLGMSWWRSGISPYLSEMLAFCFLCSMVGGTPVKAVLARSNSSGSGHAAFVGRLAVLVLEQNWRVKAEGSRAGVYSMGLDTWKCLLGVSSLCFPLPPSGMWATLRRLDQTQRLQFYMRSNTNHQAQHFSPYPCRGWD